VYGVSSYIEPNDLGVYSLNSSSVQPSEDGTTVIQFGDCDGESPNCLPITPGWNYMVRLYRLRPEILDGSWTFPEAEPVA
jgi:hypothetical protein